MMSARSQLGSLSLEILEKICIFMLRDHSNLAFHDLLKASPDLYCRLRTPAIKQELVLKTLFDVPASWKRVPLFNRAQNAFFRFVTITINQNWFTLTAYKFVMVNFFKKEAIAKYEEWALKHSIQHPGIVREKLSQTISRAFQDLKPTSSGMSRYYSRRIRSQGEQINSLTITISPGYLRMDFEECSEIGTVKTEVLTKLERPGCLYDCALPRKLLVGPWTNAKLDFLQLLLERGMSVDYSDGAVATQGLEDAIRASHTRALTTLLPQMRLTNVPIPEALISNSKPTREPLHRLNIAPTREHFQIAVLETGCRPEVVEQIAFANPWACHQLACAWSHEVYNWAVIDQAVGGGKGTWLLECYKMRANVWRRNSLTLET